MRALLCTATHTVDTTLLDDQCARNPQLLRDDIKMKTGHLKKVEQARAAPMLSVLEPILLLKRVTL